MASEIMHYTAGAVVLDGWGNVLLIRHRNHGKWLQPGGRVEKDEVPAEAAVREVREETGIEAEVIGAVNFTHPSSRSVPLPFAILDRISGDRKIGPHRCVSFVYVCRPVGGELTPQLDEVSAARWVPISEIPALDAADDLLDLVSAAAHWAARQVA
jgi:8-oxo-dGTP pyrophosphatase MutT (NUDIX family)